jgi:hypothetical protein
MSRKIIYVLMYHHHKLLDLMNSRVLFLLYFTKTSGLASKLVIATNIVLFTADLTVLFITKE